MRRSIETNYPGITFLTLSQRLWIYPETLSLETLVGMFIETKRENESLKKLSSDGKITILVVTKIRREIKNMVDLMPWPPQANDLMPDKFIIPHHLDVFLNSLLSGKILSNMEITSQM